MTGTLINCAAIIIGAVAGKLRSKPPQRTTELYVRVVLGAFIVFYGLRLVWVSINGPFLRIMLQLLITIAALGIGRLLGKLLGLQKLSNRLGQFARNNMSRPSPDGSRRFNDGFATCAALFCAAPLGLAGAVSDGLSNYYYPLAAKGVMEAFAAFGFVRLFGWGVAVSAVPVLAFQGTLSLAARMAMPFLEAHNLVDPVNAVSGFLIFSVALVMLEIKKLHLADYLPSLLVAPLLAWVLT